MTDSLIIGIYQAAIEYKYRCLAEKLARCPVGITWERMENNRGLFFKKGGRYYIKLHPDLNPDQTFKTFLHECSHARLHSDRVGDVDNPVFSRKASPIVEGIRAKNVSRYEAEAWDIANAWLELAGDGPIGQRIKRLMEAKT